MRIEVITLFPQFVDQVTRYGMAQRACAAGALQVRCWDLRDFAQRADRRVDERPFGGGPGMVLQAEPAWRALRAARESNPDGPVMALSPRGDVFTQAWAHRLAAERGLTLLCGRYEGLDERLMAHVDLQLSIGDFVLSGGELAAMLLIDAVARLLPGVLGNARSACEDSFSQGLFDHPQYTRPRAWRGEEAPDVLLSGDHAAIRRWRLRRALGTTWLMRPELIAGLELNEEQQGLLRDFIAADGRAVN